MGFTKSTEDDFHTEKQKCPLNVFKVDFKSCPSTFPLMHVRTHTCTYTQKLCCLLTLTPDPAAGLHVGAQAQQQIHPQP